MDANTISLSSMTITHRYEYDVFLSFRGGDTRKNFTDHLYASLIGQGIATFRDHEELDHGKPISQELLTAIEKSRIAIVVLSRNYASSTWCLEELVKILQCNTEMNQTIFPIFYNVRPSDVRNQKKSFAGAFANHEKRFRGDEKIRRWRDALVQIANLKGWNSSEWYESELIKEIAEEIWKIIQSTLASSQEDIIGIDSKLKQLEPLFDIGSGVVRLIGIWGVGGIGKTTIARAIYETIHQNFEVSSFITNIREESQRCGLPVLQNELISRLLPKKLVISDVHQGRRIIQKVLCEKKVLLVLDDVDDLDHLDALIPDRYLFGSGSRVVITTRNAGLLTSFGVERKFQVNELEEFDALQLLSSNVFNKKVPEEGFDDLFRQAVKLVGRHPLALKVLGSTLRNKNMNAWSDWIEKLKEGATRGEISSVLKIIYDDLSEKEKEIFLDLACFFKGKKKEWVMEILDVCGFKAKIIDNLIRKTLIFISDNKLWMHDLIQGMGREIVRQNCSHQNSRLWFRGDVMKALTQKMDTQVIQSIVFKEKKKVVNCRPNVFSKMHSLRLLNIRNVFAPHGLECLPNEIRYMKWNGFPLEFLPTNFEGKELIELHLCHSNLKLLWREMKHFEKLKYIKLNNSLNLLKTPNFSEVPNLQKLNLEGCINLLEIDPSISVAKSLTVLNLKNCKTLTSLPRQIHMESLEVLILSGCSKVDKISEFKGNMERLLELCLDGTCISELPISIGSLSGLTFLNLKNCKNLRFLPDAIRNLNSLQHLNLSGCGRLSFSHSILVKNLLKLFPFILKRELIDLGLSPFEFGAGLRSLRKLDLSECNLGVVPDDIGSLSSLTELHLCGNNFRHLPASLSHLSKLQLLRVNRCEKLLRLSNLPPNLKSVKAVDCISLTNLPNPPVRTSFDCVNCFQLNSNMVFAMIKHQGSCIFDMVIPGSEVPYWITTRTEGREITAGRPWTNDWIGFAICVVFEAEERMDHDLDVESLDSHCLPIGELILRIGSSEKSQVPAPFCYCRKDFEKFKSSHIWLSYIPRSRFHEFPHSKFLSTSSSVQFQFSSSKNSTFKIKQCGIHFMRKEQWARPRHVPPPPPPFFFFFFFFLVCIMFFFLNFKTL